MESKLLSVVILLIVFSIGAIDSADPRSSVRPIHLSEITPQGILHLTPTSKQGGDEDEDFCDYLVTVSSVPHNTVGISVGVLGMELMNGAFIQVVQNPVTSSNDTSACQWAKSISSSPKHVNEECLIQKNNDACIQLRSWRGSSADLLLNIYYDGTCPEGTIQCQCNNDNDSSEEDMNDSKGRCIPKDLACNGVSNCGKNCAYDESEYMCPLSYSDNNETCIWTKFEYLAMLVMTGLLLLLIPILFLLTIMYHRRRAGPEQPSPLNGLSQYDGNNNRTFNVGRYPHVISTAPVNLEPPPRYEDLPDDIKITMPSPGSSPSEQCTGEQHQNN